MWSGPERGWPGFWAGAEGDEVDWTMSEASVEFPVNDLERELLAASEGRLPVSEWVARLATARVWVPLRESAAGSGTFPVLSIDGSSYVPVFTSEGQIDAAAPANARVCPPVAELVRSLPESVGLAVNPGRQVGLPVSAAAVREALGMGRTVPAGTRLRIGEPAEEPVQLLADLAAAFAGMPAVREARRAWAAVGENSPGLVLGLDIDPDNDDVRRAVLDGTRSVVDRRPVTFTVDVVFSNDRTAMTEWMQSNVTPFYPPAGSE